MASKHQISRVNARKYADEDHEDEEELTEEEEEKGYEGEYKGSLDQRERRLREWDKIFLLVCGIGLFVDPLFLYPLSLSDTSLCFFIDGWFAVTATVLRCMTDAMYIWNMWLRWKNAKKPHDENTSVHGASSVALRSKDTKGFGLDLYLILPLPQIVLWVWVPSLLARGAMTQVVTVSMITFFIQFFPRLYHSARILHRVQSATSYVLGTLWWGIVIYLIVYFVAANAAGGCWFLLGAEKVAKCLKVQCGDVDGCGPSLLSCPQPIYYGTSRTVLDQYRQAWADYKPARTTCTDSSQNWDYEVYEWIVNIIANNNRFERLLCAFFWAIMTLRTLWGMVSTFGNLHSCTEWSEAMLMVAVLTIGLLLVTVFIGYIKIFLQAVVSKKQDRQLKMRNIDWWMRRRNLPREIQKRVRNYERKKWAAMRGIDEAEMIRNVPEGLRRDIKYHLCLDLVRQVPLFQHVDDLVLENICDRVKSLIFPKGETITREGDPVQRMLFIVRGHLESSQVLRDGVKSCCKLGPGNFSGDELLSWCLRRPFIERLPPSTSTLVTIETTEAFGLEAEDVKFVTQHFRYTFLNEKVKRISRYYSPGWRTWAAVAIQLAWRRYRHRLTLASLSLHGYESTSSRFSSLSEDKLKLYTAMLTSPKPNQDDFGA
ncbi:Cyclic nucleotide-binding domain [Dillenia turbinata]|uniref:Cyclic nucleotide-binding domain n=1 Tax=Dillenia turbinata TaxID=194707 RepID=A0AAN8WEA4_9MAGN